MVIIPLFLLNNLLRKCMKILLTGGSGMVGRNVQDYAKQFSQYQLLAPSSAELNLLDKNMVDEYLGDYQPDAIIHSAGIVGGIQANIENPVKFLHENTLIGQNIVLSAYQSGVKNLINLGSSCMYPRNAQNPLVEDSILAGELEPTNEGYALAKIVTAKLCEYISRTHQEYQYKTLIPCNLYGEYDKFDPVKSHMIPSAILKIHQAKVNGLDDVEIWGDGTARREFMYAQDLACAIFFALDNLSKLPNMVNVGLGEDYSINEYYQQIAKVVGYQGKFVHDLSKPVGMKQKLVNTDKLTQLGWQSRFSLEQGLEKTYQYYLTLI